MRKSNDLFSYELRTCVSHDMSNKSKKMNLPELFFIEGESAILRPVYTGDC